MSQAVCFPPLLSFAQVELMAGRSFPAHLLVDPLFSQASAATPVSHLLICEVVFKDQLVPPASNRLLFLLWL